jgi:hypothetical protein
MRDWPVVTACVQRARFCSCLRTCLLSLVVVVVVATVDCHANWRVPQRRILCQILGAVRLLQLYVQASVPVDAHERVRIVSNAISGHACSAHQHVPHSELDRREMESIERQQCCGVGRGRAGKASDIRLRVQPSSADHDHHAVLRSCGASGSTGRPVVLAPSFAVRSRMCHRCVARFVVAPQWLTLNRLVCKQYNLCHIYPPTPQALGNRTPQLVVLFIILGLDMQLVAVFSFLCFTKQRIDAAVFVLMVAIITNVVGFMLCFRYYQHVQQAYEDQARYYMHSSPNLALFVDAYTHPALKRLPDFLSDDYQITKRAEQLRKEHGAASAPRW